MIRVCWTIALLAVIPCSLPAAEPHFKFRDTAQEAGMFPALKEIHGHGAGWGDVDGDGWLDLYVGMFRSGGGPNVLLRNHQGKFQLDPGKEVRLATRATGVALADLDNDGDNDLYVSSMPGPAGSRLAERAGEPIAGCSLFRNDGAGKFTNISAGNGACPEAFGGRSVALLDFDGDGLLDMLVGEDPFSGYNGSKTTSSRLFRNLGKLQFKDVSQEAGLTAGLPGLGVAAADVNNDTWPDLFLAASADSNRLFLNDGKGHFAEAPGSQEVFAWPDAKGDNMVCGVTFGDVNRDGLVDIVLGQHYRNPWIEPVANRLYLNRGIREGVPKFEDVTEQVGLTPLPMKAPHVEIQDFDNDGLLDISTSLVFYAGGQPHPVIFRNLGNQNGLPKFSETSTGMNDFPTDEDSAIKSSGKFFEKMVSEGKIIYSAPGPSADYDNDGRLDFFLGNWWTELDSLLLHNETPSGHWLQIQLQMPEGINRAGIGSRIRVYPAGKLGDAKSLIVDKEMSQGFGYASGQAAIAHLGLGDHKSVDLEITLPHGKGRFERAGVPVDQRITLEP